MGDLLTSRRMRASDFRFDLPAELIAQYPCAARRESRLLVVDAAGGGIQDRCFDEPDSNSHIVSDTRF